MVNSIQRDKRRRLIVHSSMLKRNQCKALLEDASLPEKYAKYVLYRFRKISRSSSITRVRNRCILTSRGRGVLRFCKLSRIRFREYASQGNLMGVNKSSW